MNILCRCLSCCGMYEAECERAATQEDGLCDWCRTLGPASVSSEIRIATGFDPDGFATGWKTVAR